MIRRGEKQDAAARQGHPVPFSRALERARSLIVGALGLAVASLLLLASVAFAAPPANDKFADAEGLGSVLPIQVSRTNVEATEEEAGEPFLLFTAGHSVWFQWGAPVDEVVTIDTCNSEFPTSLAVFTGASLGALTNVGEDSNSDGRYCPDAAGVTFRAMAATTYSIMVDGNGFHFPEGPAPLTQGSFELKISKTPSPPNDDFANPIVLSDPFGGGDSYFAHADGFNWNATKEVGEPDHAGDSGGASIWYEWTAPASGSAEVGACQSLDFLLGLYTGNSVDGLSLATIESRPVPCFINFFASAGTTYRIALDGKFDPGAGLPKMGSPGIRLAMKLPKQQPPAGDSSAQQEPPDMKPPNTRVSRRVLKRRPPIWIFVFDSTEADATFQCKLDKHPFTKCRSSKTFKHPKPGRHILKVRAVDPSGNVDGSPAVARFTVPTRPVAKHR